MLAYIKRTIKRIAKSAGYDITVSKKRDIPIIRHGTNINVGCGSYVIDGFIGLDIYTDHYHSGDSIDYIEYDLRKDCLPFSDNSVDNIYASHVIEHIETGYVMKFIGESHRVLRFGGVLRIACPDAEFLYRVTSFENDYWSWRKGWFSGENGKKNIGTPTQVDFLIRELATPKCRLYVNSISDLVVNDQAIQEMPYAGLVERLQEGLVFREGHPGDHINAWDFGRLNELGQEANFRHVIRSKPGGSVSLAMQGADMDRNCPQMSLYVDMVK